MSLEEYKIFYSWQSDLDSKTNKNFIQNCLKNVIKKIGNKYIKIDRDTKNLPGSPAIADSILAKIDSASIFIGDVSIITNSNSAKPCPNPNVLLELGYAIKTIGWDGIILIMNTNYGDQKNLPFDLQHRRWPIDFKLIPNSNEEEIKLIRDTLIKNLSDAINSCIKSGPQNKKKSSIDIQLAILLSNAILPLQNSIRQFSDPVSHKLFDNFDDWKNVPFDIADPKRQNINKELLSPIAKVFTEKNINSLSGFNNLKWNDIFINDINVAIVEINKAIDRYPDNNEELVNFAYSLENNLKSLLNSLQINRTLPQSLDIFILNSSYQFNDMLINFLSAKIIFGKYIGYF